MTTETRTVSPAFQHRKKRLCAVCNALLEGGKDYVVIATGQRDKFRDRLWLCDAHGAGVKHVIRGLTS